MREGQCLQAGQGGESGMKKGLGALGQGELARGLGLLEQGELVRGSGQGLHLETSFLPCKLGGREKK